MVHTTKSTHFVVRNIQNYHFFLDVAPLCTLPKKGAQFKEHQVPLPALLGYLKIAVK